MLGARVPGAAVVVAIVTATAGPSAARSGLLDREFGDQGLARAGVPSGPSAAKAVVVRPDRRIVVAGRAAGPGGADVALVGYLPDGTLDRAFGSGGRMLLDLGGDDEAAALALAPGGTLLIAGSTTGSGGRRAGVVARFDHRGVLDPTFGEDGRVLLAPTGASARLRTLAIAPDGSPWVAGSIDGGPRERALVARLDVDGHVDVGFGDAGVVVRTHDEASAAYGLALQSDGRAVVAGRDGADVFVARYRLDGTLDDTFGDDGVVRIDVDHGRDVGRGVAIQVDGRVVVAGATHRPGEEDFVVLRLDREGNRDPEFNGSGLRRTDFGGMDAAHAVLLRPDGRILLAGRATTPEGSDLALASYLPDGRPDPAFGTGGRIRTDLESSAETVLGLAFQPEDRVLAAGARGEGDAAEMALVAYRSRPARCGDGFVEGAEICDLGADNGLDRSCCSDDCAFRPAGDVCRPPAGPCDSSERCSGESAICPPDELAIAGRVCRPVAGACDFEERCTGIGPRCPTDRVRDADAVCRAAVGPCDAAESCDGSSPFCPGDQKGAHSCRPAIGPCDRAETCDGASDACPEDRWQPDGAACRDGDPCTVGETCAHGACVGGTYEPFLCGALLCRRGTASRLTSNRFAAPLLVDGLEDGGHRWRGASSHRSVLCAPVRLGTDEADGPSAGASPAGTPSGAKRTHRVGIGVEPLAQAARLKGLIVRDRFGRRRVSVVRPAAPEARTLAVPAAVVSGGGEGFGRPSDYLKCYDLRRTAALDVDPVPVWREDGGFALYDVKRLEGVCVPVGVDENPVLNPEGSLTCYRARAVRGSGVVSRPNEVEIVTPRGSRWRLSDWRGGERLCVPAAVEEPELLPPRRAPAPSPPKRGMAEPSAPTRG